MAVAAMRASDVVVRAQRFADPDGNCFFTNVQMSQARHQCARVQLVHLLLEQSNAEHPPVHAGPFLQSKLGICWRLFRGRCQFETPDIRASTSNPTAKSFFSPPMPRAAV